MTDASSRQGLVLSESRGLRLFSFFLFYFGQGLPYGLTTTALPVWVAANGGTSAQVAGVLAMAYLPWSWKFIVAAVIDRYAYLPMGRRRLWLILAQVMMSAGFVTAALLAPGPRDIDVLLVVTFLVMAGGATQDVAVDALAVDVLPEKEQGTASAFMFGGQALGGAVAGAGGAAGLQYLGSATTFLLFIPFLLIPPIYSMFMRERPGEKRFPWSEGKTAPENRDRVVENWAAIIKLTFKSLIKGPSLLFLTGQSLSRMAVGIAMPMWPLLGTRFLGMDETTYGGMASTIDLVMAILAIGVGALVTARFGPRRGAIGVLLAFSALFSFIILGQGIWTTFAVFAGAYAVKSLLDVLISVCTNPLRMQLCDKRVSATQFTIYNSLANLPVSLGATLFAIIGGVDQLARTLLCAITLLAMAAIAYAVLRMPSERGENLTMEEFEEGLAPRVQ